MCIPIGPCPSSTHLPQEKPGDRNVGGCLSGHHNARGWLLTLSGMQDIQQRAGQPPARENHPAPNATARPLKNTVCLQCGKTPQSLCELETVYNSITKDNTFSGEVREPVPRLMYYLGDNSDYILISAVKF